MNVSSPCVECYNLFLQLFHYSVVEKHTMDSKVIVIAPIKEEEEINQGNTDEA